jgi:hypothetical protein
MRRRDILGGLVSMAASASCTSLSQPSSRDPIARATLSKRYDYWSKIGKVDAKRIEHIINRDYFYGHPSWPNSEPNYLIVRPPNSLIIASDGLSNVIRNKGNVAQGWGCEVFIEVPEFANTTIDEIKVSWAFAALQEQAMFQAALEGRTDAVESDRVRYSQFSLSYRSSQKMLKSKGLHGTLQNMPMPYPAQLSLPLRTIRIIPVTLIGKLEDDQISSAGGAEIDSSIAAVVTGRMVSGVGHRTVSMP